jgi:Arc/MetJ-type ribon-helix-helix transcriptional regulator
LYFIGLVNTQLAKTINTLMAVNTFRMPDELDSAVEEQLSYGDSKSEYIRTAIKLRLELAELCGTDDAKAICELVEQNVEKKKIANKDR